jgi:hypothetical protein
MSKMELNSSTDATGSIRIRLPGPPARYSIHVVVEWEEKPIDTAWPAGWFETTAGAIDDPSFIRQDQGVHEKREGFE